MRGECRPIDSTERRERRHEGAALDRAKALALRVLSFRARTEAQVRARLSRAGLAEQAGEVLAWLRRLGYVDDAAYAGARARALLAPGRIGPRMAEARLVRDGVDPELARAAVAAATEAAERSPGDAPELALCRAALARKLRGAALGSLDDRGRARLARFLLGRGFSPDVVARAVPLREVP